jgi:hypothetical protein
MNNELPPDADEEAFFEMYNEISWFYESDMRRGILPSLESIMREFPDLTYNKAKMVLGLMGHESKIAQVEDQLMKPFNTLISDAELG